jgi:hypothetical protein
MDLHLDTWSAVPTPYLLQNKPSQNVIAITAPVAGVDFSAELRVRTRARPVAHAGGQELPARLRHCGRGTAAVDAISIP